MTTDIINTIICKRLPYQVNMERLNAFKDILINFKCVLKNDELKDLYSHFTYLQGLVYEQSWEAMVEYKTRNINSYFKGFVKIPVLTVEEIVKSWFPLQPLVVPDFFATTINPIFVCNQPININNDLFIEVEQSYINMAYYNAVYNYSIYSTLISLLKSFNNNINSTKFNIPKSLFDIELYRSKKEAFTNLLLFANLSTCNAISEQSKMIITSDHLVYTENDYIKPHHCTYRDTTRYLILNNEKLGMVSGKHDKSLLKEVRDIHDPLFKKHLGTN